MMVVMTFQSTSTRPIQRYLAPYLGRRTTIAHMKSDANSPVQDANCIISTTIRHLEGSGGFSDCASAIQIFKCSAHIPDGPPVQFGLTCLTSHSISSSDGTLSATSTGSTNMSMGSPKGGTHR